MKETIERLDVIARLEQIDAEERERAQARDADRKEFFDFMASVVDALPDALIVSNEAGEIILANGQAELIFGYHRTQLIGQPVELLVPDHARCVHAGHREKFFEQPQIRYMGAGKQLTALRRDGREIKVEIMLAPVVTRRGIYALAVLRRTRHG